MRAPYRSIRPVIGKMVINADISAAAFYKSGPLIKLCLEYLGANPDANPVQFLSATRLDARARRDLAKFLRNLNIQITRSGQTKHFSIKAVSEQGASNFLFDRDGTMISIAVSVRRLHRLVSGLKAPLR